MSKERPWRVSSPADNYEEDFATEEAALADAEKVIQLFREEAYDDGEWNEDVEFVQIYQLCHSAQINRRESHESGEAVDYGMAPVPQAQTGSGLSVPNAGGRRSLSLNPKAAGATRTDRHNGSPAHLPEKKGNNEMACPFCKQEHQTSACPGQVQPGGYAHFEYVYSATDLLKEAAEMWECDALRMDKASEEAEAGVAGILQMIAENDRKKAARARELVGA